MSLRMNNEGCITWYLITFNNPQKHGKKRVEFLFITSEDRGKSKKCKTQVY